MVLVLGKVRIAIIKRTARKLLANYPDYFTEEFEHNKKVVRALVDISSKKTKNQIAGYITRLVKLSKRRSGLSPNI